MRSFLRLVYARLKFISIVIITATGRPSFKAGENFHCLMAPTALSSNPFPNPWSLGSERQLMFRAESINLFNTPQFAEPGRDLVNPNFGQITNTLNDGRALQFTLQFSF